MATLSAPPSAFLGGGVSLKGVRGFDAVKPHTVTRVTRAVLSDPGDAFSGVGWTENGRAQRSAKSLVKLKAIDLWQSAQRIRQAASGVSCFAALSANGAAFSQMQSNAHAAELWRKAGKLEDAAVALWEQLGMDVDVDENDDDEDEFDLGE
jgi:hypothetical protein